MCVYVLKWCSAHFFFFFFFCWKRLIYLLLRTETTAQHYLWLNHHAVVIGIQIASPSFIYILKSVSLITAYCRAVLLMLRKSFFQHRLLRPPHMLHIFEGQSLFFVLGDGAFTLSRTIKVRVLIWTSTRSFMVGLAPLPYSTGGQFRLCGLHVRPGCVWSVVKCTARVLFFFFPKFEIPVAPHVLSTSATVPHTRHTSHLC